MSLRPTTFHAFGDELIKIAILQTVRRGFVNAMKEGWQGTPKQIAEGEGATWFGKGRQIRPGMGRGARMLEEATSLGGATRALPIGSKTLMVAGTGLMAREAFKKVDATGQQRSRPERVGGLAANTVGGLLGSAVGNRLMPGLTGSIAGGYLGGMAAEKLVTAPFAAARRNRLAASPQPPNIDTTQYGGAQV